MMRKQCAGCPTIIQHYPYYFKVKRYCCRKCWLNHRILPPRSHATQQRQQFSREYHVWITMRQRCRCKDKTHKNWPSYGSKGITVSERWKSFANFMEDMGPRPGPEYTIERKNNSLGYCKENCKWATRSEQMRNRRNTDLVEYNGKPVLRIELEEKLGMSYRRINDRLRKGWTLERAINQPQRKSPAF